MVKSQVAQLSSGELRLTFTSGHKPHSHDQTLDGANSAVLSHPF